ncbi:MAG: alpha/beta fold hydrolase [Longimicrobiales bacterium]|nr:alpha/beta fold hydrolase [Longimicrobiales bacterium]
MKHRRFAWGVGSGSELRGDVRWLPGPESPGAVIVVHGFKGFKDWGFFPRVCRELARAGLVAVSFNFSRNGIGDDPLEFTALERFAANTLSLELDELLGVIRSVQEGSLPTGRPSRIGLLGHSRGGAQAILAAAEHEGVDALATWAAVADFDRWDDETKARWRERGRITVKNARTGQEMPLDVTLLEDFEANRDRLDVQRAARRVTVPWLVVHGEDDETVDPEEGRRLAALGPMADWVPIQGAGHTFQARHPFDGAPPELEKALAATLEHFQEHLPTSS